MLSEADRITLLTIARETIRHHLEGRSFEPETSTLSDDLRRPAGAFVTLTIGGDLRGCIGSIVATSPLFENVRDNALNAATRDPRFPPLKRSELERLHLEISVMSPIEPVTDLGSIVVGRDGLIIRDRFRSGLLLPQVATEYGWDREAFLSQTCRKAGLPADAWREGKCRIEKFSAEVFAEPEHT